MLRITKQSDYGIVLLSYMAGDASREIYNARDVASEAGLPLPMVSKTLKALARAGLLVSQRGVNGGYGLARPAAEISVAEIVEALEGPIAMTECSVETPGLCDQEGQCPAQANWMKINRAVQAALETVSLEDMIQPVPAATSAPRELSRI